MTTTIRARWTCFLLPPRCRWLAEQAARKRAERFFVHPSDWQIELMYDGAVQAVIATFQSKCVVKAEDDAFRRYLLRAMALGAIRAYFRRGENDGIRAAADLAAFAAPKKPSRNEAEGEIITLELLEQVTSFPQVRPPVRATLECIRSLGPDHALKEHAFTASGDPGRVETGAGQKADPRSEHDRSVDGSEQSKGAPVSARGSDHSPPGIQSRRQAVSDALKP